jgi:glycosyltransferase involved in cell wall biosynthesis
MNNQVNLIWLGEARSLPPWPLGDAWASDPTPLALHRLVEERLPSSQAESWLFWDSRLGVPSAKRVQEVLALPGDLWHAGLRLGMGGTPGLIDFIYPTWMLNSDPDSGIEATSWRLSLRACLIKTDALRQVGGVCPDFRTLEGAALELGHRFVMQGVMTRHIPSLVVEDGPSFSSLSCLEDELRFVYYRYGGFWSRLALLRALMVGYTSPGKALRAWRNVYRTKRPSKPSSFIHNKSRSGLDAESTRVSVLIPTLDRYPYLRTLLKQLRDQTITPLEIIVVDQTAKERRNSTLADEFDDLPLKMMYLDQAGQCSSRNAGLCAAEGDYILFIDDDDEVPSTLIEKHLENLQRFGADASSGVADEVGAGPLPETFTRIRTSDVFPTNNSLVRKDVLRRSGLFDLAYERGQRADGDLGMRLYLSGALMVLNPEISVLHHHAPSGGLRAHKARVVTYASSRRRLTHRHLLSPTEIYLAMRYFSARQLREELWLRTLGTFITRGSKLKQALKFVVSLLYLPDTLWKTRKRYRQADSMRQRFPQIPWLADREDVRQDTPSPGANRVHFVHH